MTADRGSSRLGDPQAHVRRDLPESDDFPDYVPLHDQIRAEIAQCVSDNREALLEFAKARLREGARVASDSGVAAERALAACLGPVVNEIELARKDPERWCKNRIRDSVREQKAISDFVEVSRAALTRYAVSICKDRDLADDLVQTAHIEVWLLPTGLTDEDRMLRCKASIRWRYLDTLRLRERRSLLIDLWSAPTSGSTPYAGQGLAVEEIIAAIKQLPTQQATAMTWRALGHSVAEIADKMDISQGSVKRYLFDARASLRNTLFPAKETEDV